MKTVLTIAGSDCSGGAGIQADIKTITAHKLYAESAVTALTAQNTMGVSGISECEPDFLQSQLQSVFSDIFPDAVKIGMLVSSALVEVVADVLKQYQPHNIVVDPVMIATSGKELLEIAAREAMKERILPLADLITPNLPEAEALCGRKIETEQEIEEAAKELSETYRTAVLIKGGHRNRGADDLLYDTKGAFWFRSERINNPNLHGTGCTLSAAIACRLAEGYSIGESVHLAKKYLTGAIRAKLDLGKGNGPLEHGWWLEIPVGGGK